MSKEKKNYLGFRLNEKVLDKLDLIASQTGRSRGIIAKDALRDWIDHKLFNQTNEIISIPKTILIRLVTASNQDDMEELSVEIGDIIADIMNFLVAKPMSLKTLTSYGEFIISFFGKRGLNWFNTIDIKIMNPSLVFRGYHDLEEAFSGFFVNLFKYVLNKHFNLEFISEVEKFTSSLIHLEFKLKNY